MDDIQHFNTLGLKRGGSATLDDLSEPEDSQVAGDSRPNHASRKRQRVDVLPPPEENTEAMPFKAIRTRVFHTPDDPDRPNVRCPLAGCNVVIRATSLKEHLRLHLDEKGLTCRFEGCLQAFSTTSERHRHETSTLHAARHTNPRRDPIFTRQDDDLPYKLPRHQRPMRSTRDPIPTPENEYVPVQGIYRPKTLTCIHCNEVFSPQGHHNHEISCTGPKDVPVTKTRVPGVTKTRTCIRCHRVFIPQGFHNHEKFCTGPKDVPVPKSWTCVHCHEVFAPNGLASHEKFCTGPKDVPVPKSLTCVLCHRVFAPSGFHNHKKFCTGPNYVKASKMRSTRDPIPTPENEDLPATCVHCHQVFAANGLARHEKFCMGPKDIPVPDMDVPDVPKMRTCIHCHRLFLSQGHHTHQKFCMGPKDVPDVHETDNVPSQPPRIVPKYLDRCSKCGETFHVDFIEIHELHCSFPPLL